MLSRLNRIDAEPHLRNMNLVYGFTEVLLREMEALLTEWELTGEGAL